MTRKADPPGEKANLEKIEGKPGMYRYTGERSDYADVVREAVAEEIREQPSPSTDDQPNE